MSRRDASRLLESQMHAPWDPRTAPQRYPENNREMLRALREWEIRRGLSDIRPRLVYGKRLRHPAP